MPDHTDVANNIAKYNIQKITDLYRLQRGRVVFKKYEQIARIRELISCMEKPIIWQYIEENESEIAHQIMNKTVITCIEDLSAFEEDILQEYKAITHMVMAKNTVWCDGSYYPEKNNGGAAAIIEMNDGRLRAISRHLPAIFNSTEAEMHGMYIALVIASVDKGIRLINTDSQSIIAIAQLPTIQNASRMREDDWSIRNRIRALLKSTGCRIAWVKAHSGIYQNEMADIRAKEAAEQEGRYIAYVDRNDLIRWRMLINGVVVEKYPRTMVSQINSIYHRKNQILCSESYRNLLTGKTAEQTEYWNKALKQMNSKFKITMKAQYTLSFVLKLHSGILPCNMRQFCWGYAKYANCSLCDADDDNIHFAKFPRMKEKVEKALYGVIEKFKLIQSRKDPNLTCIIKRCLINNFNDDTVMRFIPEELIRLWKDLKLSDADLIKCGKYLLDAMYDIWKERCRLNEVRCEKCERRPTQGPKNFEEKDKLDKILRLASTEIIQNQYQSVLAFW